MQTSSRGSTPEPPPQDALVTQEPSQLWPREGFRPCAVIPCYNHTDRLPPILDALIAEGLDCVVVDDGSDASSRALLVEMAAARPRVTLLHHAENKGKGGAVKTGLRHARQQGYSHGLQIDADGQHDTSDIKPMLAKAQRHPEALILGRPQFDESIPKGRLYPRYITHVWVWIETLSLELKDSMCGFRVYPLDATVDLLDRVKTGDRMDFDIEIAVRLFWRNIPFVAHDTAVIYHPEGSSHFRLWHDNALISWLHTRLFLGMCWRAPWLLLRRRNKVKGTESLAQRASEPGPDGPGEAETTHWSKTQERGSAWGIKFVMGLYRIFGRTAASLFLWPLIGYFFLTGRRAREASLKYLRRLYACEGGPKALPRPPDKRMSFKHFLSFGQSSLDKLSAWLGDIKREQIDWPNRELILSLIERKQGAVFLGAHLGNIEVLRAIGEDNPGLKLNVLVFTKHAAQFNAVVKALNPDSQVSLIPVDGISMETSMRLKQSVERGEMVAILADRVSEGTQHRAQEVPFLGHPAAFPEGPFILASLLQCPVFLLFCLRSHTKGRYDIALEPFADQIELPRKQRKEALHGYIAAYAARLEAMCLQAPLQWYNFFDVWASAESDAPRSLPTNTQERSATHDDSASHAT